MVTDREVSGHLCGLENIDILSVLRYDYGVVLVLSSSPGHGALSDVGVL